MVVTQITSMSGYKDAIKKPNAVIGFLAAWNNACKIILPKFEQLSNDGSLRNIEFFKIDVDAVSDASEQVGIRIVPTFVYFRSGQKVKDITGPTPAVLDDLVRTASAAAGTKG